MGTWVLIAILLLVILSLMVELPRVETDPDRLNWFEVVPERFVAVRNPACSRDHIIELVRFLREHVACESTRLIEECYELSESDEISLHDHGPLDWNEFEQALVRWDFSHWQSLLPDSRMVLADASLYLVIDTEIPMFLVAIAETAPRREELAAVLKEQFGGEFLTAAAFEWRFLSHASREVGYGGDLHSYTARSETES